MNCGIYRIKIDEYFYFGQTKDFVKRKSAHKKKLQCGWHKNIYMQRVFNSRGEDNFVFEKLIICPPSELNQWEGLFVDKYYDDPKCMNLTRVKKDGRYEMSEQTRKKLSALLKGREITQEHIEKLIEVNEKDIVLISPNGENHEFKSVQDGEIFLGVTGLNKYLYGERPWPVRSKIKGWTGYYKSKGPLKKYAVRNMYNGNRGPKCRSMYLIDPNGKRHEFKSIKCAAEFLNYRRSIINEMLLGTKKWPKRGPIAGWKGGYM